MNELQIFNYEGNEVTFKTENGEVMINATEMAKPFGKKVNDWLRLSSTTEYLQVLENQRNGNSRNIDNQLVKIIQGNPAGGIKQGTWMHEDAALPFAQWLSPKFYVWCNKRIKELMKYGVTATPEALEKALTDPDSVIKVLQALKEEREEKELAEATVKKLKPAADYTHNVLQSESLHTTTIIAKELEMGAVTLNRKLKEKKIQYKHNGVWVLCADYQNKGYTKTKTKSWEKDDGTVMTRSHMYWSERGRAFLHSLLNKTLMIPSDYF